MNIPNIEFCVNDIAKLNGISLQKAKKYIDSQHDAGNLIYVKSEQVNGRGRPAAFYKKK